MAFADRAFRALARNEPDVVIALLRCVASSALPADAPLEPGPAEDPHVDAPPTMDADWVARAGEELLHVEWQGYRDTGFLDRLFRYHVGLVLRFNRPVRSIAPWIVRPNPEQRRGEMTRNGVTIHFHSVYLPEVPASTLLVDPACVCFAPAADAGGRTDEELCARVATELKRQNSSALQQQAAVAIAAAAGRYDAMIRAMANVDLEPVVIEDLVRFGEDRGFEKGLERGIEQGLERGIEQGVAKGLRDALVELVTARGFVFTPPDRARVDAEGDAARLRAWIERAATATSLDAIFHSR